MRTQASQVVEECIEEEEARLRLGIEFEEGGACVRDWITHAQGS